MTDNLHVLVLAAGASTRLGQAKQLVHIGGQPALHRTLSTAAALAGNAVSVVIGAHAKDITQLVSRSGASMLVNRRWEEGIASSIRCGIAALPAAVDAVLILLGDQVCVTADDLKRLRSAWNGQSSVISAAFYDGHIGVPAIFPRAVFSELLELQGDVGARSVLRRNPDRLMRVAMPNAAFDLDTPDDLEAITKKIANEA